MLKSVGASTQPSFTPLLMGKGSEDEPSNWTVPCMSSGRYHLEQLGWTSNLPKQHKLALPADKVKGLGQVNESNVEWLSLLTALLLELAQGEYHVDG